MPGAGCIGRRYLKDPADAKAMVGSFFVGQRHHDESQLDLISD
jgi:hypothetical protein